MNTKSKKIIGISLLCALAVVVLGGGLYMIWLRTAPAMPENLDDAAAVLTSARFQRLPADRKLAYTNRMRQLAEKASPVQRQAFWKQTRTDEVLREQMRDLRREQLVQRARAYALGDDAERNRMMQQMMAEFRQRRASRHHQPRQQHQSPRPELTKDQRDQRRQERRGRMIDSMQQSAATGNPQDRQLVGEMFRSMRQKMGGRFGHHGAK